jgi:hypothetical protein
MMASSFVVVVVVVVVVVGTTAAAASSAVVDDRRVDDDDDARREIVDMLWRDSSARSSATVLATRWRWAPTMATRQVGGGCFDLPVFASAVSIIYFLITFLCGVWRAS